MSLESKLQAILDEANIEAGIAVTHVESGEQVEINGSQRYPMASVFKIPIIAAAGQQLARGGFSLDDRVALKDEYKSPGSGILPFFEAGLQPTRRDLLTLMIIISDNTATDINIDLLGGTQVIEDAMHALGLTDISIKMNCKNLIKGLFPPEVAELPPDEIRAWSSEHDVVRDGVVFSRESDNNVSSAASMTKLVTMLFKGEIVDGAVRDEVMGILYKQQLKQRLPRFLPPTVEFGNKTGTIASFCNDSGVMTIDANNHVAVTAFTAWDDQAYWQQPEPRAQRYFEVETAIGKIGKQVYDHYSGQSA
ncbi:MAG: serine hydrolase [Anaerolineae bacterium]|nr:serine hydrolase [Anaerolineae bacterium]